MGAPPVEDTSRGATAALLKRSAVMSVTAGSFCDSVDEIAQRRDDREANKRLGLLGLIQESKSGGLPTCGCRQSRREIRNGFEADRAELRELLGPWLGLGEQGRCSHHAQNFWF